MIGEKPGTLTVTVADARPRESNWNALAVEERVVYFKHVWLAAVQSLSREARSSAVPNGQVPPKGVAVDSGGLGSMVRVTTAPVTETEA